ncbi:MAG: hypothetical protein RKE49_02715 [Oceanicaulis sp.]
MRAILILTTLLGLTACGRNEAPDEPLYVIDQSAPAAAPDPGLEGCWSGVITTSVEPRRILLDVSLDPARVRLISPGQGGGAIAFEQVRLDGPRLAAATRLGAFRFDGALDGDGRLAGEVIQGGLVDNLSLEPAEGC